jgi:beta-N-acetylhexosaminidase
VATLRVWLADARFARASTDRDSAPGSAHDAPGGGPDGGDSIGLVAARLALRRSGPVPTALADPLVVEVEPAENIAAGRFTWGFETWADVLRVDPTPGVGADDGVAADVIIATAAGRPLVVAVRGALEALPLVSEILAGRPDAVVVEMGIPVWTPPPGTAYLATYGASRASAQAAVEALGLSGGRRRL